jgi:hypothetical protein
MILEGRSGSVFFSDGSTLNLTSSVVYVNASLAEYNKIAGSVSNVLGCTTNSFYYHTPKASLDTNGVMTSQSYIGGRNLGTISSGTYNVNLGLKYQDVNVTTNITVALTNWAIFNATNAADVKVLFYPGSGNPGISFSSIGNLWWSSESGTATAPTSIPSGKILIVDFTVEVNLSSTNIIGHYSFAPYTP